MSQASEVIDDQKEYNRLMAQSRLKDFQALGPFLETELDGCWKVEEHEDQGNRYWQALVELRKANGQSLHLKLFEDGTGKTRSWRVQVMGSLWGKWFVKRNTVMLPNDLVRYPKITLGWERVRKNPKILAAAIKNKLVQDHDALHGYIQVRLDAEEAHTLARNGLLIAAGNILGIAPDLREKFAHGTDRIPDILLRSDLPGFKYSSCIQAGSDHLEMRLDVAPELAFRIAATIKAYLNEHYTLEKV